MSFLPLLGSSLVVGAFGAWWFRFPLSVPRHAIPERPDGLRSPLELVLPYLRTSTR